MAVLRPFHVWSGPPALLTVWRPSDLSLKAAQMAPVSPVPPSYEQAQHLRAFRECKTQNEEMARLLIVVWEENGSCDVLAMTRVITEHLRRHDTYHSWFEERGNTLVRHVLTDPSIIEMEPVTLGQVNEQEWRKAAAAIPAPFEWGCFGFGILQRENGFTCFASIDQINADVSIIGLMMAELHIRYHALIEHKSLPLQPSPGSYLNYCTNQNQRIARIELDDPDASDWIKFLNRNNGRMPSFVLPLGLSEDRCLTESIEMDILDDIGLSAFDSMCHAHGARMIGGLLACAALAERELVSNGRYSVVTPMSTRKSPQAFRTAGWCMGVIPIDFDLNNHSFSELIATAQHVFDERLHLANLPIERVLELASGLETIRPVATGGIMLSYNDMRRPPFSPTLEHIWRQTAGRIHISEGMGAQVAIWFFRSEDGLTLAAAYPANETARNSMQRYVEAIKAICSKATHSSLSASDYAGSVT